MALNLTCFFQLRQPNARKRLALDCVLSEYTRGMVEYLDWGRSNLDYLRSAGSIQEGKYAGQYNKDSMTKVLPKASQINVAVSSKVRDALLTDAASCMAGYFESCKINPDTQFPTAFRLVDDERSLALEELRFAGTDIEEERELFAALHRSPKSTVRPAYFCRSSDIKILTDETLSRWFIWINALAGGNDFAVSATCDGSLIDINSGDRFYYTGKTGLLLPIEIGIRNGDYHWQFTDYLLPVLKRMADSEPNGIDMLMAELSHYKATGRAAIKSAKLVRTPDDQYRMAISFEFDQPKPYAPETYLGVSRDTLWDLSYALIDGRGKALDVVTEQTGIASLQISTAKQVRKKQEAGRKVSFRDYRGDQLDGLLHTIANRLIKAAIQNKAMIVCESTDKIIVRKREKLPVLRRQFGKLVKILQYKCKLHGVPLRTEIFGAKLARLCPSCGNEADTFFVKGEGYYTSCKCGSVRKISESKAINVARRVFYKKAEWIEKGGYLAFHQSIATRSLRDSGVGLRQAV